MDQGLKLMADQLSGSGEFEPEERFMALERTHRFFIDLGENDDTAREDALDLVSRAMEAAPRFGFGLAAMIDHMLLSHFHRVPRFLSFIEA